MRKWRQKIRRTATEWLSLPPDALLDVSRLTCIDGGQVVVENMKALLSVSETAVEVELQNQKLLLQGENFVITMLAEGELHLQGTVSQISYQPKKGGRL
jgi:sporulation protein YqfC